MKRSLLLASLLALGLTACGDKPAVIAPQAAMPAAEKPADVAAPATNVAAAEAVKAEAAAPVDAATPAPAAAPAVIPAEEVKKDEAK